MYPLKFEPILKERLWGGSKLIDVLGKNSPHDKVGESWEISTVKGAVSVVINGAFKGMNFQDIINKNPINVLGENVVKRFGKKFPILIKFIDAKLDLSIQLHPDDELAKKRHNSLGKKEMWYIMDAPKKANLIIGFNKTIRKEEYQRSLKENTLLDLLNYESVKEGDAF
ncbi:class I mannose-6-phosphate isomerase, partial [Flavobacteriaceae bacterium]|nr:class I mannose-6-phosphate isomerase [Flavobacteriaceae bacterium]